MNTDHVLLEAWCGDREAAHGESGVAVVTALNARTMPLIRYEIGDRIVRLEKPCSCGSGLPLIGPPWGRADDVVVLPTGRWVPPVRCTVVLRRHLSILQFQITQKKIDQLTILLVTSKPWRQQMIDELRRQLLQQLGEPMTIDIQCVDNIPHEERKFRSFISLLPREVLDQDSRV